MERVGNRKLENRCDYINRLMRTPDMVHIEYYNGMSRVCKFIEAGEIMGRTNYCTHNLSLLGTKRESLNFLNGMAAGLTA